MERTLNLLVVESGWQDFQKMRDLLRQQGMSARCRWVTTRRSQLLEALGEQSWDAVLFDYNLPALEFNEGLALVKAGWPDLPVILVSGNVDEEEAIGWIKEGVCDFISRDHLSRLAFAIDRGIRDRAASRANQEAEEAVRASERKFRLLVEGLKDDYFFFQCTPQHELSYVSPSVTNVLGYSPAEFQACAAAFLKHVIGVTGKTLPEEETEAQRMDFLHRDGEPRHLEVSLTPLLDHTGQTFAIAGLVHDITLRHHQETILRQAAVVFNNTREGVIISDPQGNIQAVNQAFTDISGYPESELIHRNMRELQSGEQDRAFYRDMWRTIRARGHWQGEIRNRKKDGSLYPAWLTISTVRDGKGRVTNYVGVCSDISRVKQSERRLEHLAHHDPLTDLPNRLQLYSRLDHALERVRRNGGMGAVLFIDLDRFKHVNDTLGHPAGDELLKAVSERLRTRLRDADTVARLGGDEFVVLLEDLAGPERAAEVAQDIIEQIATPFRLSAQRTAHIGASIGISIFPEDGDSAETLLQHADAALYQAKEEGRGTCRFHTAALTAATRRRQNRESVLRHSLEKGEFLIHYQPQVSLVDGRVRGVEALLRRLDSGGNLECPAAFLPSAEASGLILPLGDWGLRQACSRMRQWLDAGVPLETLSINISQRQLRNGHLTEKVPEVLAETGLPAHYLQLEFTEKALNDAGQDVGQRLSRLSALGVRFSLDNFGTGFTSMAGLRHLPIDTLKVDRGFVHRIPEHAADGDIAAAIIAMARQLHITVLAEGVENPAQLEFLKSRGCDAGQGYLFSRPMPPDDIPGLVQASRH